jgi:hypothetical protein
LNLITFSREIVRSNSSVGHLSTGPVKEIERGHTPDLTRRPPLATFRRAGASISLTLVLSRF